MDPFFDWFGCELSGGRRRLGVLLLREGGACPFHYHMLRAFCTPSPCSKLTGLPSGSGSPLGLSDYLALPPSPVSSLDFRVVPQLPETLITCQCRRSYVVRIPTRQESRSLLFPPFLKSPPGPFCQPGPGPSSLAVFEISPKAATFSTTTGRNVTACEYLRFQGFLVNSLGNLSQLRELSTWMAFQSGGG